MVDNIQKKETISNPVIDYRSDQCWGTKSEINFVRGLGYWSNSVNSRGELLRKYLRSMDKRQRWGSVDVEVIREEVKQLLKGE